MNKKTIAMIAALVLLIGGSVVLYSFLKERAELPDPLGDAGSSSLSSDVGGENQGESRAEEERFPAPDFTVEDADENPVKRSDKLGKPVVLNFWASWCPPCRSEMPEFNKVFEEMGDEVEFMMVDAVDGSRETKETGAAYIAENGYTFPVYFDMERDAVIQYGVRAYPTTFFIDGEGYIVAAAESMLDEETLRRGIAMITESAGTDESAEAAQAQYNKISPEEAKEKMDGGEPFILLDVRTQEEFAQKHIEGALLLPGEEIAARADAELPDKDAVILLYCRSGRRSEAAARELVEMGYTNVYDFGGIQGWPYETVEE